jgi:hypothetical protein
MRLAGIIILAVVASIIAGALAFAAVSLLPDWDDAAGRGLGEAFRALLIAVYVILSVAFFGIAIWRRNRDRHFKRALCILLLAPFLIAVLGAIDNGIQRINWFHEAVGMVQMFVPLWIVAWVQWLIIGSYLSRRNLHAESVST